MNIYPTSSEELLKYVPYTYLIGWSHLDTWYYGSQTSTGGSKKKQHFVANPKNLWVTYFTSSKHVDTFRKLHGEPDVIKIRKTFTSMQDAIKWESTVIRRIKAAKLDNWLNKHSHSEGFFCSLPGDLNPAKKLNSRRKISSALKGRERSVDHCRNIGLANKGKRKGKTYEEIHGLDKAKELRKIRSTSLKGKKKSTESINKFAIKVSKIWNITFPDGHTEKIRNLVEFCKQYNLNYGAMYETAINQLRSDGKLRIHKGYYCRLSN